MRSLDDQVGGLGVETLLFCIKKRQLRWFGCLLGASLWRCFLAPPTGEETQEKTQNTMEGLYISPGMGTPKEEVRGIARGEEGIWVSAAENGWMDGFAVKMSFSSDINQFIPPCHSALILSSAQSHVQFAAS